MSGRGNVRHSRCQIYRLCPQKTSTFLFFEQLCEKLTDFDEFWWVDNLTWNLTDLSTSPVRCSHCTFGNRKKSFSTALFIHTSDYLRYLRRKQTVIHLPSTWKCHRTECKTFSSDWSFIAFFQTWEALKRASCRLSSVAMKKSVVMCGNWHVRQAVSQQMFRATTFGVSKCFQSFSTLISYIVTTLCWNSAHVATSRCRKPGYVHINTRAPLVACPRCSTRAMHIIGGIKQQ